MGAVADKVEVVQVFLSLLQYSPASYPFTEPQIHLSSGSGAIRPPKAALQIDSIPISLAQLPRTV